MQRNRLRGIRFAMVALALLIIGPNLANPRTSWAQPTQQIVYVGFGGVWQAALRRLVFDPFERETGIRVIDVPDTSQAKLKAMVTAGRPEWDVVDLIGSWLITSQREGLLESLDMSQLNTEGYPPGTVLPYAVAVDSYAVAMAYNTRSFTGRPIPRTWTEFWDAKKFPGRRAFFDNPRYALEFALLADGVPIGKLYPLDVQRAFRKLDQLKPNVYLFFNNWSQPGQLLADGALDISMVAPARIFPLMAQGEPINVIWNGGGVAYDYLVIPKGSAHKAAAMKLIAWYANNPRVQAEMARVVPQGPVNPKAAQYLSFGDKQRLATTHLKALFSINWEWWADNGARVEEQWNEWKLR